MKKHLSVFVTLVIVVLSAAPAINLTYLLKSNSATVTSEGDFLSDMRGRLYNLDFASSWLSRILYPYGISTDPKQVIIGHENWLYLGDQHKATLTLARRGSTAEDQTATSSISNAMMGWDDWLKQKGVHLFRIMIAPNKSTLYPEHLPTWATPVYPSVIDTLLASPASGIYVDFRRDLAKAKRESTHPLYYRTDTHWNELGATSAFRVFAGQLRSFAPDLLWPTENGTIKFRVKTRTGGDLARFLRMSEVMPDDEPTIGSLDIELISTIQYDFHTGKVVRTGGNPKLDTPKNAVRIEAKNALNRKKVVWLRDSFGTALSPLMAATFTETVQLHWEDALKDRGKRLIEIVELWKPDYVFVTVVERAAFSNEFYVFPPLAHN